VLRLGDPKEGPSFRAEIEKTKGALPDTRPQPKVKTWRSMVAETRRHAVYGISLLAVLLAASVAYFALRTTSIEQQIAAANAAATKLAQEQFSKAVTKRLLGAVYLVVKREGGVPRAEATAWAFAPTKLATNAHVTEAIKGTSPGTFYLIGPNGERIDIDPAKVKSHPGYMAFGSTKHGTGTVRGGSFTPLDLTSAYDVGIIEVNPATPLAAPLEVASEDDLRKLDSGTPVAAAGFPSEGLVGSAALAKAPEATLQFGYISSLKDVFMCRTTDAAHRLLVQHSVPVAGGASGSPMIDATGKVIAIVSGGNVVTMNNPNAAIGETKRAPNAALVNFAQRADLLLALDSGSADSELEKERSYWKEAGKIFDRYYQVAVSAFLSDAKERYGAYNGEATVMGTDVLDPGKTNSFRLVSKTYTFEAKPGFVYGLIADAEGGVPVGINVKRQGSAEFLRDAKDPRQTSELELAPTAWVTVPEPTTIEVIVWSLVTQPANYVLHAYRWEQPTPSPAADAASAIPQQ
jgi:Trypsin-like peptidase domain